MGCGYSNEEMADIDNPMSRKPEHRARKAQVIYSLRKLPVWGLPGSTDRFEWPTEQDLYDMPDDTFHLKSITLKSFSNGMDVGICSIQCDMNDAELSSD